MGNSVFKTWCIGYRRVKRNIEYYNITGRTSFLKIVFQKYRSNALKYRLFEWWTCVWYDEYRKAYEKSLWDKAIKGVTGEDSFDAYTNKLYYNFRENFENKLDEFNINRKDKECP